MFTVVYVLVEDGSLYYYNELMKSVYSIRLHMKDQAITVLVDDKTSELLSGLANTDVYSWVTVKSIEVDDNLTIVEKSRYLKLSARQVVEGDMIYIDTDTVICEPLPDEVSDESIAMVLELNALRNVAKCGATDIHDKCAGIDLAGFNYYFNSGVIWSKDDEFAHDFYNKWFNLWQETRKKDTYRDQPSLNYLVKESFNKIGILDNKWNVQIATQTNSPINYLSDALIIHYMNNTISPYLLCRPEYRQMDYTDERLIPLLKKPRNIFDRCKIVHLDDNNQYVSRELKDYCQIKDTYQYRLLNRISRNKTLFSFNEKVLSFVYKLFRR